MDYVLYTELVPWGAGVWLSPWADKFYTRISVRLLLCKLGMYREAYGRPQLSALKPSGFRTDAGHRTLGEHFSYFSVFAFFATPLFLNTLYYLYKFLAKKKLQLISINHSLVLEHISLFI